MKLQIPRSSRNWISLSGATIALVSFFMIVFLFIISNFLGKDNSYLGLITYIMLPAVLIIGLILIPVGMILKVKREKGKIIEKEKIWPVFDFNNIHQRHGFFIFAVGSAIFLLASAVGSYEAFNYSESVEFCGTTCHTVMKPEYTAYQNSPHARVRCVDCHVGSGAGWYVKSKMSGLYQVYAVTLGSYPTPIPTPISNLRPARETCEQCHWPQKFYSRKLRTEKHFLSDEKNSEWDISLVMKIGSNLSALGLQEGIHKHISNDIRIEYKASDEQRQTIPWVRYTNLKTGESVVYEDKSEKMDKEKLDKLETRVMDCMDCHNRPSHNYQHPVFYINQAMTSGEIPKELPEIKSVALQAISKYYSTTDSSLTMIAKELDKIYKDKYPAIYNGQKSLIDKAIKGLQKQFSLNVFPEMKVKWNAYPNNIGHLEFKGCFRCHNDSHTAQNGKVISKNCNLCHSITVQGAPDKLMVAPANGFLEFKHPGNQVTDEWKEMLCVDCHSGIGQ